MGSWLRRLDLEQPDERRLVLLRESRYVENGEGGDSQQETE
jgi:hypothetical protein